MQWNQNVLLNIRCDSVLYHHLSCLYLFKAWSEFARNVSGEWDGFGADFSKEGNPIELPESVVPEAYREWEVKVFDWQTQCPTLAQPEEPVLVYKSIKLLPTVGCEADAATRYSIDERNVGGPDNNVSSFAYQPSGCYVAVWPIEEKGPHKLLELEHCLINPQDRESRVRIIQVVRLENEKIVLQGIRVFVEQWYGPFRNGDQLGGCAIRDSAFASTAALKASDVVGVWEGSNSVASFDGSQVVSCGNCLLFLFTCLCLFTVTRELNPKTRMHSNNCGDLLLLRISGFSSDVSSVLIR